MGKETSKLVDDADGESRQHRELRRDFTILMGYNRMSQICPKC